MAGVFSALPVVFFRFVLPRVVGCRVVGERSPVDFLVWLVVTLRDVGVLGGVVARLVLSLHRLSCPRSLYVRADLSVLRARRAGSPEAGVLGVELVLYDWLAGVLGVPVLDTSGCSVGECVERARVLLGL